MGAAASAAPLVGAATSGRSGIYGGLRVHELVDVRRVIVSQGWAVPSVTGERWRREYGGLMWPYGLGGVVRYVMAFWGCAMTAGVRATQGKTKQQAAAESVSSMHLLCVNT